MEKLLSQLTVLCDFCQKSNHITISATPKHRAIIKHNIRLIRPVIILGKFSPLGHILFFQLHIVTVCSWYQGTISIFISLCLKGAMLLFIQSQILSIVWLATRRRQSGDKIIPIIMGKKLYFQGKRNELFDFI